MSRTNTFSHSEFIQSLLVGRVAGAGLALEFHLAEAHGDAEGNVARVVAGG